MLPTRYSADDSLHIKEHTRLQNSRAGYFVASIETIHGLPGNTVRVRDPDPDLPGYGSFARSLERQGFLKAAKAAPTKANVNKATQKRSKA